VSGDRLLGRRQNLYRYLAADLAVLILSNNTVAKLDLPL